MIFNWLQSMKYTSTMLCIVDCHHQPQNTKLKLYYYSTIQVVLVKGVNIEFTKLNSSDVSYELINGLLS